jgi:hypothetical protein
MHRARFVFGITAFCVTTGIVVIADQGHSGAPKPSRSASPHAVAAPKPPQPKGMKAVSPVKATKPVSAPKTVKPASASKAPKPIKPATPKATKPVKSAPVKLAKVDKPEHAKLAKLEKPAKTAKAEKTTAASPTPTTTGVTLTPVQQKLQKNTNLAAKLASRLPAGTDLMTASAGFKNLGQFVAAVNVSNNLAIPFADLKTKMVTDGKSLGQAIQVLKPAASATIEAQHAEYDARGMIADSEQQPSPTIAATTTSTKAKPRKPVQ